MSDARFWLQRFAPCVLLREDDGQLWVTDHARIHRVPRDVADFLAGLDLSPGSALEVRWGNSADDIRAVPSEPLCVRDAFRFLVGSGELQVTAIDRHTSLVHLTTSDSQTVYLDRTAYEQAKDDGVTLWIGRGPDRPVYGAGERSLVQAIVEPTESPLPTQRSTP